MAIFGGWRLTRRGVVFVIGIIVLVGLVFVGIYGVRERAEQARRDEAVKIAEQNLEEQSQPVVTTDPETSTQEVAVDDGVVVATDATGDTVELPVTGLDPSRILIVTLLSLATAFYITSRRAARDL